MKNDQRGKAIPTNRCSAEAIQEVFEHINSFPAYESHYTRKVTSKKYENASRFKYIDNASALCRKNRQTCFTF